MAGDKRIPTNMRMLLIMEAIGKSDCPLTPTEINQHLGLPKQSIHRLCKSLVDEGYLSVESGGKRLQPSQRMLVLASGLMQASHLHVARHQILKHVATLVGETVNFVMPEEDGMNYVDRVETGWPLRVQLPIGSHVPFHCTASGKVFLAALRSRVRKSTIESIQLDAITPNTINDPKRLIAELKQIARAGFAVDNEEFLEGMVAIAVPVMDKCGRFFAALAIHGPTTRLSVERAIEQKAVLVDASRKLTNTLFA